MKHLDINMGADMKSFLILVWFALCFSVDASAQVRVDVSGYGVRVQTGKESGVIVNSGQVESDVQMEGVAIINEKVFIDGDEVPRGKTAYISKKNKKTYHIQWGKDGNVSVSEK
jgi:hypothetical protein